jgi:dihydrofolate reductase
MRLAAQQGMWQGRAMAKTTYYISSSVDGFVADDDDSLDWLYEIDRGGRDVFEPFIAEIGAFAMGAATYECVLRDSELLTHPEKWQEEHRERPAWVFTHRELPKVPGADITFVSGDVQLAHQAMMHGARGKNVWVAGGGALATAFVDAGLLDEIVLGVVPVLLGRGKPLFTGRLTSSRLSLVNVERFGQVVYLTYTVRHAE